MLLEVAGGVALAAVGSMAWAVRGRSSAVFGKSVWRGDRRRRAIALTFDDGPSESTPALLDLLDQYRAPATFFLCGVNVRRLPGVAREIVRRGHQVGNHSDEHRSFQLHSPRFVRKQVTAAQRTIADITGVTPVLLRAPYGVRWFGLRRVQQKLGLTGVMWTAIGRDWKLPPERVAQRLLRAACNGAIFCLHDGRENGPHPDVRATVETLKRLLPELTRRGYHFETVSRILQSNPPEDDE